MDGDARLEAIELALAQAKRVQRESRYVVQSLARLRDSENSLQADSPKEQDNDRADH